jgi:hypothetical protein
MTEILVKIAAPGRMTAFYKEIDTLEFDGGCFNPTAQTSPLPAARPKRHGPNQ